jgi:hypothetical protein
MRLQRDRMTERFGPFTFTLGLAVDEGRLNFPVLSGKLGPLRLPRAVLPVSAAFEVADGPRARFDVALTHPMTGLLVHYRGWLVEDGLSENVSP